MAWTSRDHLALIVAVGLELAVARCGGSADTASSFESSSNSGGGATTASTATGPVGGHTATGGAATSTGGATTSVGGATTSVGGATTSVGGAATSTGGTGGAGGAGSTGGSTGGGSAGNGGMGGGGSSLPCPVASAGMVSTVADGIYLSAPRGVAVDASCNIYVADYGANSILRIDSMGSVTIFAGTGAPGLKNGFVGAATFNAPSGVAIDPLSGDLLVADSHNHAVRRISNGTVSTEAGSGLYGFNDGPAASAKFTNLSGIAVSDTGVIFVADPKNKRIRQISAGVVSTFAGTGVAGAQDGPTNNASFDNPTGVCVNSDGSLMLVSDTGNNLIRKIEGGLVSTFSGTGNAAYAEGAPKSTEMNAPQHIAMSSDGSARFSDMNNLVIRSLSAAGATSLLAGVPQSPGKNDGPLLSATFSQPYGVAVGPGGMVVVGDSGSSRVRVFYPSP